MRLHRSSQAEEDQNRAIEAQQILAERRPIWTPMFVLGTVVILSTIIWLGFVRPFSLDGTTRGRSAGASIKRVVKAQIVSDVVASKLSSWMIAAGRGLPA